MFLHRHPAPTDADRVPSLVHEILEEHAPRIEDTPRQSRYELAMRELERAYRSLRLGFNELSNSGQFPDSLYAESDAAWRRYQVIRQGLQRGGRSC